MLITQALVFWTSWGQILSETRMDGEGRWTSAITEEKSDFLIGAGGAGRVLSYLGASQKGARGICGNHNPRQSRLKVSHRPLSQSENKRSEQKGWEKGLSGRGIQELRKNCRATKVEFRVSISGREYGMSAVKVDFLLLLVERRWGPWKKLAGKGGEMKSLFPPADKPVKWALGSLEEKRKTWIPETTTERRSGESSVVELRMNLVSKDARWLEWS